MKLQALLLPLFLSFGRVHTLPAQRRDVYSPPISYPTSSTVWYVGYHVFATWQMRNAPPYANITNTRGKLLIGYEDADGEHIDFNTPLAKDFDIRNGHVELVVPDVPERDDGYFLVLMGDSGNRSPSFSVLGGSGQS